MKKIILIIFTIINTIGISQNVTLIDSILWLTLNSDLAKPIDGTIYTQNDSVNSLFDEFGVTSYVQAMPFAKNPLLRSVCEIKFSGSTMDFAEKLEKEYDTFFKDVIRHENVSEISTYDPSDYMWSFTNDSSYLWHILKIWGKEAWDITLGSPDIKIAIMDHNFDVGHPDLKNKISPHFDPYDSILHPIAPDTTWLYDDHGTTVASFAGAETLETGIPPDSSGQLASIGFKTMLICYHNRGFSDQHLYMRKALHSSNVMHADILTSSSGPWTCDSNDPGGIMQAIVKEILDNGTAIIMPAGNGEGSDSHCHCIGIPDCQEPFIHYILLMIQGL